MSARKLLAFLLIATVVSLLWPWASILNVRAEDYSSPATVRYEYYNWYDNPIGYEILEDGGSIVDVIQEVGEWWFIGSTPWSGITYENHCFHYRLVVIVENNRPGPEWPYTNTHYGFRIRIWDTGTLKYLDDMRDPLYDYDGDGPGSDWYPSPDCHFIPIATSFINYTHSNPWEREFFQIGINWRCQLVIPEYPFGTLASVSALAAGLCVFMLVNRKTAGRSRIRHTG